MNLIAPKDDPTERGGPIRRSWRQFFSIVAEVISSRWKNGIDTTDYIVADSETKGFVMRSPNDHFWVATIDNAGSVTWTDVGTTKP